jgi:hypothetical protein
VVFWSSLRCGLGTSTSSKVRYFHIRERFFLKDDAICLYVLASLRVRYFSPKRLGTLLRNG